MNPEDLGSELRYSGDDNIGRVLNGLFCTDPVTTGDTGFHYPTIVSHLGAGALFRLHKILDQEAHDAKDEVDAAKGETDYSDLINRLRGEYRVPITDGLGPAGGEEPGNPKEFVRTFPTSPINKEAADAIETLLESAHRLESLLD